MNTVFEDILICLNVFSSGSHYQETRVSSCYVAELVPMCLPAVQTLQSREASCASTRPRGVVTAAECVPQLGARTSAVLGRRAASSHVTRMLHVLGRT